LKWNLKFSTIAVVHTYILLRVYIRGTTVQINTGFLQVYDRLTQEHRVVSRRVKRKEQ
jgi:hypothetical protein